MNAKVLLPTLSDDGWVNASIKTADYLLSSFFISDFSQTYIYHGNVSSLPYIIQANQGDILKTCGETRNVLETYFSRYFNNVVVEVTEVPNKEDPTAVGLGIYIKFTDTDNKEHILGKILEIANTSIKKIIDINNG